MTKQIDPIFFDNKCPRCGSEAPSEIVKFIPCSDLPSLTLYFRCKCGYSWSLREERRDV